MKLRNWFVTSALLLSVNAFAGFDQTQQVQDTDVQETVNELRRRCEIYEQHDQIYPFKIKVNFRGRFVNIIKKPFCATFGGEGQCTRKLSMKYNRFCTPDQQEPLSGSRQLQVECNEYYAQKYETLNKGPLLSFELASCADISVDNIKRQTIQQLNALAESDDGSYFVGGSELLQHDSCASLREHAQITAGSCVQDKIDADVNVKGKVRGKGRGRK